MILRRSNRGQNSWQIYGRDGGKEHVRYVRRAEPGVSGAKDRRGDRGWQPSDLETGTRWRRGRDSTPHIWPQPRSQAARSIKVKPVAFVYTASVRSSVICSGP